MGKGRVGKAVAYHEAAHAVARAYVCSPICAVEIRHDGSGLSEGTGEQWECATGGQYASWDLLIVLLAGACAEARISKRPRCVVQLTNGADDFANAQPAISWLVARGYARDEDAAWRRAEAETAAFVQENWADIERVAIRLLQRGRMSAEEVRDSLGDSIRRWNLGGGAAHA